MSEKKPKSIPSSRSNCHQPFGKVLILQIVKEVEDGLSRKKACASYGMAYSTLTEWMAQYGSDDYHTAKKAVYSLQQKRSIVRFVQQGRMTKKEACLSYGVNKRILNAWLLQYKRQQEEELSTFKQEDVMNKNTTGCHSDADSGKEIREAKLKIAALETMIDLAEQQGISIRKNSGAKQ